MKYKIKLFITAFLILLSTAGYSYECTPADEHSLSKDLSVRQLELQDLLDECPSLTNAINYVSTWKYEEETDGFYFISYACNAHGSLPGDVDEI